MDEIIPTEAPQASTVLQVSVNIFMETLQGILGFTSSQVRVLVNNEYDNHESVLYWKFAYIKEWGQIKSNIPEIFGGVSYGDRKIQFLLAMDWWVTYLMLRGKIINLNNLKTDILADAIDESRIDFEDTRYGKGEMSKPK